MGAVILLGLAGIALLGLTILMPDAEVRALFAAGTLAAVAGVVLTLRGRIARLIGELDRAAGTDPLTGVLNRRRFDEQFAVEVERQHRTERPLALVLLDLDRFKRINDSHGHEAGDRVLREFAAVLEDETRAVDVVARLGGDEFAVLAPETDGAEAAILAERLRERVRACFADRPVPLTVSAGVAIAPNDGPGPIELSRAADRALYRAKSLGRDLVAFARAGRGGYDVPSRPLSSTK